MHMSVYTYAYICMTFAAHLKLTYAYKSSFQMMPWIEVNYPSGTDLISQSCYFTKGN
jgi:hypothetical protein